MIDAVTLDDVLHTITDLTRRAIVKRLSSADARVTAIAEPFTISELGVPTYPGP